MEYFKDIPEDYVLPQPIGYITPECYVAMEVALSRDCDEDMWITTKEQRGEDLNIPVYAQPQSPEVMKHVQLQKYGDKLLTAKLPSIEFMQKIVQGFYEIEGNSCGGGLHIVLDDCNVEESHILWCIDEERNVNNSYSDMYTDEVKWLGSLLLQYTYEERIEIVRGV